MTARRKSCRLPIGEPCQSVGKRGPCATCHDTSANAERMSKRMKALHANPEFTKAHAERHSKRMKALNAVPEFAKACAERLKALNADPEFARRRSKWPNCPPHLWDEYRGLQRRGLTAAEARAAIDRELGQ